MIMGSCRVCFVPYFTKQINKYSVRVHYDIMSTFVDEKEKLMPDVEYPL